MSSPVAIITGAGSGVGRAVAERLAASGYRLALVGRRAGALRDTAGSIASAHGAATPGLVEIAADVSVPEEAAAVVDRTVDGWGRVDVLVNNAAMIDTTPLAGLSADTLHRMLATNTVGPVALIVRAWPAFRQQGGGRVVNISSIATTDPFPGLAAYAASKAALESITRSIVVEGGADGIEAYAIALGAVETAMLRSVLSEEDFPRENALAPEDAARVVVECVRGERVHENGTVIVVQKG